MILLQQMIVLFIIMMVGFLCRRTGLLDDEASKKLSGLVVNVANPALMLSAVMNTESAITGKELAITFGLAMAMYAIYLVLAEILPKLLRVPARDRGAYKAMLVFSNIGFMGYPLLAAMYGQESILYASVFTIPYNILIYTYGVSTMETKQESQNDAAEVSKHGFQIPWKKIFNIGVIACMVSIVLYFLRPQVPVFIEDAVDRLGSLTAPLSMIVIGDAMANMKVRDLLTDKKLMLFSGMKLLLLPIIAMSCVQLLGLSPMLTGVLLVMLSTPVGSMTAMLAQQYDGNYELASKGVALTTILSVITMPIVSMITGV